MDIKLNEILKKYKEYSEFFKNINKDYLMGFSMEDLMELKEEANSINFTPLSLTAFNAIKDKEELLRDYYDKRLKEITFLSEESKKSLDKWVGTLGKRFSITNNTYWNKLISEIDKREERDCYEDIINFLLEKEIITEVYKVKFCCRDKFMDKERIEKYLKYFKLEEKFNKKEVMTDEELDDFNKLTKSIRTYDCCDYCYEEDYYNKESLEEAYNKELKLKEFKIIKKEGK